MRPVAGPAGHEPRVGDARVLHVRLGAREHPVGAVRGRGECDAGGVPGSRRLGEGPGGDASAVDQPGELRRLLLRGAAPGEGVGDHVDGEERSRRHQPARLLGHEHEIEEAVAADAPTPEVVGDEHRRPTELGAPAPEVAIETDGVVEERADLRERALGVEEAARRLDEQLLVALQLELHLRRPLRSLSIRC